MPLNRPPSPLGRDVSGGSSSSSSLSPISPAYVPTVVEQRSAPSPDRVCCVCMLFQGDGYDITWVSVALIVIFRSRGSQASKSSVLKKRLGEVVTLTSCLFDAYAPPTHSHTHTHTYTLTHLQDFGGTRTVKVQTWIFQL